MWVDVDEGLAYNEVRRSDGRAVCFGEDLTVHYTLAVGRHPEGDPAWLENTWNGKGPFRFTIGKGEVLEGIDRVVVGMSVSAERRILMSPRWGFKERGVPGAVPPDSELTVQLYIISATRAH